MPWFKTEVTVELFIEADDEEAAENRMLEKWPFNQPFGVSIDVLATGPWTEEED